MERYLLGLILGLSSPLWWPPILFNYAHWMLLGVVVIFLRWRMLACILVGIGWAGLFFQWQTHWLIHSLPNSQGQLQADIEVLTVKTYPDHQKITAKITSDIADSWGVHPKVQLHIPQKVTRLPFHRGDTAQIHAKLTLMHGIANPAGFNTEHWLMGQQILASGTVLSLEQWQHHPINWRDHWLALARQQMNSFQEPELLMALIFGEQQQVDKNDWQLLRNTGLIHLIAISGMHIGLVAWLGVSFSRLCFRRWVQSVHLHALFGLLLAAFYCALADFSPPTVRALWMLVFWFSIRAWQRRWSSLRVWLLVLTLMLLIQPWDVFSAGLWLSFIAVGGLGLAGFIWKAPSVWRIQILMTVLLIPFQLWMFEGFSLTSVALNLIAEPWFTLLIIPVALISGLVVPWLPLLAHWGFWICDWQLHGLMVSLALCERWLPGWQALSQWQTERLLWGLLLGIYLYVFSVRVSVRQAGFWLILAGGCCCWFQSKPQWRVDMLDIGQGLSVLISQGEHAILFDTGDAYPGGFNMADAVIFPMLRYRGIAHLDWLMISHKDKDHAANWELIHQRFPQTPILSSGQLTPMTVHCQAGQSWQWLSLRITVLSPTGPTTGEVNEDSCVVRISDGLHSVLLTGDVQGKAEQALAVLPYDQLHSDILSSPHHGSHTSSSAALIAAVSPQVVVHSTGFKNRWKHPHEDVVARYQHFGIEQWNTARVGLVSFVIDQKNIEIEPFRRQEPWYRQLDTWLLAHQQLE